MRPRVYIAAPLGETCRALVIAEIARRAGLDVVSRWHDDPRVRAGLTDAGLSPEAARAVAETNHADLASADAAIVATAWGGPRETLIEAGAAIQAGKPVFWICGKWRPVSSYRSNVFRIDAGGDGWADALRCVLAGFVASRDRAARLVEWPELPIPTWIDDELRRRA